MSRSRVADTRESGGAQRGGVYGDQDAALYLIAENSIAHHTEEDPEHRGPARARLELLTRWLPRLPQETKYLDVVCTWRLTVENMRCAHDRRAGYLVACLPRDL